MRQSGIRPSPVDKDNFPRDITGGWRGQKKDGLTDFLRTSRPSQGGPGQDPGHLVYVPGNILRQFGWNETRRNTIDIDPGERQLDGQGPGQRGNRTFGRTVDGLLVNAQSAGNRGDINDSAARPLGDHLFCRILG